MDRVRKSLMPLAALSLAFAGFGAESALAQETGGRYRVLVPALLAQNGARDNFGKDVAKEVKDVIDELPTHAPVDQKDLREALRRYGLKEDDLKDCIKARQLAVQMQVELVMCGSYTPATSGQMVQASFIAPTTGDAFEVAPFQAAEPEAAAQQISAAFAQYLEQLRVAVFCHDAMQSQNWEEALTQCGRTVEINPSSPGNNYNIASVYFQLERDEEALAAYKKVIELNPVHQDALLGAGITAARLGRNDESQQLLNQYLELNPGNQQVRLKIASDVAQAGDPVGGLRLLEAGMSGDSVDVVMSEYAGHFALNAASGLLENPGANGNEAEAHELLEKALGYYETVFEVKGDSTDAMMLANMLRAYRLLERNDDAVTFGQRAIAAKPNDASLLSAYADVLSGAGRADEAIDALNRAAQIDPELKVSARLGGMLVAQGKLTEANAAFRRAVQNNEVEDTDQIARVIFVEGFNNHHKAERWDPAINYYEAAREYATSPQTRGMINFFHGFALLRKGIVAQNPSTVASARASLPLFQEAKRLLEAAEAYTEQANARRSLLQNADQYIAIQEALIKRG